MTHKFKQIESLGLTVKPIELYGYDSHETKYVVDAEELERALGEIFAQVVIISSNIKEIKKDLSEIRRVK